MKYLIYILLFSCLLTEANAQGLPTGVPTQKINGWIENTYTVPDSGIVAPRRDTNWVPSKFGMMVTWPHAGVDTVQWFWNGLRWNKVSSIIDTTSISNRINQKLNITDTTGKWLSQLTNFVDTVYRVNDSTVGYTVRGRSHSFQILGRSTGGGGGSGTVTSVGLSMPAAFTVSGSPITTSGTLSVSGAGTGLQYVKGNGTLGTFDTAAIPNFYLKVRGELSGTSPITYNSTTGAIGINDANTSGTKGAATFNSGSFSDNGSGTISLLDVISNGSCLNCQLTYDSKGRIVSASNGVITPPPINAPGAGDTLMIADDTIKRLNPGYGINHIVTQYSITTKVDTTVIQPKLSFNNGITNTSSVVQLGGTLNQNTTISTTSSYFLNVTGSNTSQSLQGTNTSTGVGVRGQSTNGSGVYGISSTLNGVFGLSTSGTGLVGESTSGEALNAYILPSTTNSLDPVARLQRFSGGTAANGIGGSFDFYTQSSTGSAQRSNRIGSLWSDATTGTRTSRLEFYGVNSGIEARKASLSGNGQWIWDGYTTLPTVSDTTNNIPIAINKITGDVVPMSNWVVTNTNNVDTVARQIPITGIEYAEQPATTQSYMWELMANPARFQWYDGVSASFIEPDTLIMFGGWNASVSYDSVFQSTDGGQTWLYRSNLPYAVHTPAVIRSSDGYTYIIGGDYLNTSADRGKVYRTKDFKNYELRTSNSPFFSRVLHGAFELNGTKYCGGGQYYTLNRSDSLFTDLYKSDDGGITWNLVSNSLSFLGKNISGCFTVSSGMVRLISGGIYDNIEANKTFDTITYYSKDALHWYRGSDLPLAHGFQYPNVYSWDGKTWIAGGYSGTTHSNVDSTLYLDKSGFWHFYRPSTKPTANHAAATIVVNDIAYRILGNVTNQVWRQRRDTSSVTYEASKTYFMTRVALDSLGRNHYGYNVDAYSQTGENEDRYTNAAGVNLLKFNGVNFGIYNGNVGYPLWVFDATRRLKVLTLRSWTSDSNYLGAAFFSPMIQAQANFPAYSWQSASHTFLIGVDGNLVKFRQEDGTTGNRLGWDITNGHMALAGNTTNGYDITTDASAVLALKSSNSGFLPPVMTTTAKNAITSPTKGLDVYDTTVLRGSHYNGTSWDNVAYTTDVIPDSSIWKYDGTMNGNHTLSGNGKTLNLGSSGSKLLNFNVNASGLITMAGQLVYTVDAYGTDADHTVTSTAQICEITDNLTNNRTLTLPSASLNGTVLTIVTHFSAGTNHFSLSAAVTDNATGSTFTQLDWGKTYDFLYDSGLAWRLIRKY